MRACLARDSYAGVILSREGRHLRCGPNAVIRMSDENHLQRDPAVVGRISGEKAVRPSGDSAESGFVRNRGYCSFANQHGARRRADAILRSSRAPGSRRRLRISFL